MTEFIKAASSLEKASDCCNREINESEIQEKKRKNFLYFLFYSIFHLSLLKLVATLFRTLAFRIIGFFH